VTLLVYDGSFDGFLCAVARCVSGADPADGADSAAPRIVSMEERVPDLFSRELPLATDAGEARRFKRRFAAVAGPRELETLLLAHSSRDPLRHDLLLEYARATLRAGGSVADRLGVPLVLAVQKMRNRVTWEIGKLLGFARFRKVGDGFWYAPVDPEANIVGFLGPHFADRFPDQRFLIHDTNRGIGYHSVHGTGGIVDLRAMPQRLARSLAGDSEPLVQSQWQAYFRKIAIPERRNPRLQDRNLPRRYWSNLIEQPGSAAIHEGETGR
jgi:probable DNA metabolism protein